MICELSEVVGQLWNEMAEVQEGMEELRVHSRVHQKLIEVQLERERKRNLVGLMRTTRGVDKDGEVVDWEEGLDKERIHKMGKKFKRHIMPGF